MTGPEMAVSKVSSGSAASAAGQVSAMGREFSIGKNLIQMNNKNSSNPISMNTNGMTCNQFLFSSVCNNGKMDGYV